MKILCTGNPDHSTIASGVQKIFPEADFASRATGYDLRLWDPADEEHFKQQIAKYDVFINSSFIVNGAQQRLLELTYDVWTSGHVFNIGSSAEYLGRDSFLPHYSAQKRSLRDVGLSMNNTNFRVTHITAGKLNDGKPENSAGLELIKVAEVIKWVIETDNNIPIIGIESWTS
jgi:hypothetical protein